MNKKTLSMMVLTGVVSVLSYTFTYADNYVFRYPAPGGKASSSLGSGTVPEDELGEELSGAQRVVEFSINPSTIRVPQDLEDTGVIDVVFSGRVANNNNEYDGSVSQVFMGISPEYLIEMGISPEDAPEAIPIPVNEEGEFEFEMVDGFGDISMIPFPISQSGRYLAVVDDEDLGKEALFSIEEGQTLEIVYLVPAENPYLNSAPPANGEANLLLRAFFDAPDDRRVMPGVVEVHWSSTIGNLENSVTYIGNDGIHHALDTSINRISSNTVGSGTITARIAGWGNAERTIPIEFSSPLSTARINEFNVTPDPISGEYEEIVEYVISGQVVDIDDIPTPLAQVNIHVEQVRYGIDRENSSFSVNTTTDSNGYFTISENIELDVTSDLVVTANIEGADPSRSVTTTVFVFVTNFCSIFPQECS